MEVDGQQQDSDEEFEGLTSSGQAPRHRHGRGLTGTAVCAGFVGLILGALVVVAAFQLGGLGPMPPGDSDRLAFLVVGDWGRNGTFNQSLVAESMGHVAAKLNTQFVVSTGDNFYDEGLTSLDDPQFTESFTNIYSAPSLQTPWHAVLGNHDYVRNSEVQLHPALKSRDPRWHCERSFSIQHGFCPPRLYRRCDPVVELFFIDTTPMVQEYWDKLNFTGLPEYSLAVHLQLLNLRSALAASSATWKLVIGHHPVRSVGQHGDTAELLLYLLPLLEEFKVDLYINGHDHCMELIKRADSPVYFVTSGGGSKAYRALSESIENEGVVYFDNGQGFVSLDINRETLNLEYFNAVADSVHKLQLSKNA